MSSDDSVSVERKIEHRLFLLSVWIKGIAGLVETVGGLLLLWVPQARLKAFVIFLTAPELAEDPTDRVATLLQQIVHELGSDTKRFASSYVIVHGLIARIPGGSQTNLSQLNQAATCCVGHRFGAADDVHLSEDRFYVRFHRALTNEEG